MACGCQSGSGGSVASVMEDPTGRPADDQVYVVTYFNGVTEEASGLDAVRALLLNPARRVTEGQDAGLGGTYGPKQ